MNLLRRFGIAVPIACIMCALAVGLAMGGDGVDNPGEHPKVVLKGWRMDLNEVYPGSEVPLVGWGGLRFRLGEHQQDGASTVRMRTEQHYGKNPQVNELAVTFQGNELPVRAALDSQGTDMSGRPVSMNREVELQDRVLRAMASDDGKLILLVQLSVVDE